MNLFKVRFALKILNSGLKAYLEIFTLLIIFIFSVFTIFAKTFPGNSYALPVSNPVALNSSLY